jgi:hypothetical protein
MSRYTAQVIACAWCCIFGAFERAASSMGTCDHEPSVRHGGLKLVPTLPSLATLGSCAGTLLIVGFAAAVTCFAPALGV